MGFFDDILGNSAKDAANQAAADTYRKQQAATGELKSFADTLPAQYNNIAGAYNPYTSAGSSALSQLMAGLGLGGDQQAFTNAYHNLPGYQSGLDTGLTGAERALNAGNMGQSGRALKSLYRYGSDYEDQRSGDYLNRLAGVSGQGLQATGAQTGIQTQGLGQQAGLRQSAFGGEMNSAGTIGQGMVAGEQAKQNALGNLMGAATYLGGAALGGGMGGFGGGLGNLFKFGSFAGSGFNGSGFPRA